MPAAYYNDFPFRPGKAMTQGTHDVQIVSHPLLGENPGAFSLDLEHKPQGTLFPVNLADGDGTAEKQPFRFQMGKLPRPSYRRHLRGGHGKVDNVSGRQFFFDNGIYSLKIRHKKPLPGRFGLDSL